MQISKRTIDILKNFTLINESLLIRAGNVLATINKQENVLARAETAETFPCDFAVPDLKMLTSMLGSMSQPGIRFKSDSMVVYEAKKDAKDTTMTVEPTEPRAIKYPKFGAEQMATVDLTFPIEAADLKDLTTSAKKFRYEQIELLCEDDGDVKAISGGRRSRLYTRTSGWERTLGKSNHRFRFVFHTDLWLMMPGDYTIELSAEGIAHFIGKGIEYWIVVEDGSFFKRGM